MILGSGQYQFTELIAHCLGYLHRILGLHTITLLFAKEYIGHWWIKLAKLQKPGEKPKSSGEYIERGPRGGEIPDPRQVTMEPGDNPLPPTQKKNRTWQKK